MRGSRAASEPYLDVVGQTLDAVHANPLHYPVVHRDTRRALLNRFPYGVFFRVTASQIRVIAIMHQSRDPARWRRRR